MINKKGVIKLDTKIWDVREYNEDLQQYPKINEIKDIVLNGGLIGLPTEEFSMDLQQMRQMKKL